MKFIVEFEDGTCIIDKFADKKDFNLWVENAIKDFGYIMYLEIL